jgi:hypothetical protein
MNILFLMQTNNSFDKFFFCFLKRPVLKSHLREIR